MSLDPSYQQFAIENHLSFIDGKGGFPLIKVENDYASALISVYGAQVLSYQTKAKGIEGKTSDSDEMLFVSESAYFEKGKAIKGGIPICWPWFGRDPENSGRPMHGFARNMLWEVEETKLLNTGATKIVLSLSESKESYKLWPHNFRLSLAVTVGKTLQLSLETINTGDQAFTITQALHAYFSVADISQTKVNGLDNVKYLDKVTGAEKAEIQIGDIIVIQEVDRIYINAPSETTIKDLKSQSEIAIESKGSETTVVWNPWVEISKGSGDLSDDAYQRFVCVETANAVEDVVMLGANESSKIEAEYKVSNTL